MINRFLLMLGTIFVGSCIIVFILSSCERNHGKPLAEPINFEDVPISTTVTFYTERIELVKRYHEIINSDKTDRQIRNWSKHNNLQGFASLRYNRLSSDDITPHPTLANPVCEIHSMKVRGQNDHGRKKTLGHELLHCLYGEWHPERNH